MTIAEMTQLVGLNADGFSELLARRSGEPAWMRQAREAAWELYKTMPMPTRRDEEWRRVDLRSIRLSEIAPFAARSSGALPVAVKERITAGPASAAMVVQHNSEDAYIEVDPEIRRQGVTVCGLDEAVRLHPDLVRKYFGVIRPAAHNKFTALHYAFQSGGTFIRVPAGVRVDKPIRSMVYLDADGAGCFPHTLILLEKGASLNYFEERIGLDDGRRQNLASGVAEIHMDDGAQIRFMSLQEYNRDTFNFSSEKTIGQKDARVAWLTAELGGRLNKGFIDCDLTGPGGRCELLGLYYINGRQQSDVVTLLTHKAPHTEGNILFKGVCDDAARSCFRGRIVVQKEASQTQSFLADHTMLLSDKARSDSVPTLEIEANDVICKHAATVGEISAEELFYLLSRGIPEPVARKMIVLGFFEEVLKGVPAASLQKLVRRHLQAKFDVHDHDATMPGLSESDMESD